MFDNLAVIIFTFLLKLRDIRCTENLPFHFKPTNRIQEQFYYQYIIFISHFSVIWTKWHCMPE